MLQRQSVGRSYRVEPTKGVFILVVANWFLLLTGGLACVLLVIRTRTEEKKLLARFGDDYRPYMKRAGRFLPRIRANRREGT